MKTFDTLYARNSNGKINEWSIRVQDSVPIFHVTMGGPTPWPQMIISEGVIDGQKTSTTKDFHKGKNIGKMNETSAYEQACSESQSRWEKKKKQGYKSLEDLMTDDDRLSVQETGGFTPNGIQAFVEHSLPQNRTDANDISKPMRAQPYFKDNGEVRIKFPCYGQPKLNGFRVMARWEEVIEGEGIFAQRIEKVVFRSKEGLRYTVLEHIENSFSPDMFANLLGNKKVIYDGEMYIHKEILSEISSAVRKRNSKTSKLIFHIFDLAIEDLSQKERINQLVINYKYSKKVGGCEFIQLVPSVIINSNEEAQSFTDACIKDGYEGAIFRDMKATYQFGKRPQTMVKLKRFQDKEFRITDVVGGDNSPELGVFVCVAENGKTFKCTPEDTHEKKREYLTNKSQYIGKKLTVRFFERTKDDLPFHAVGVAVRDYE